MKRTFSERRVDRADPAAGVGVWIVREMKRNGEHVHEALRRESGGQFRRGARQERARLRIEDREAKLRIGFHIGAQLIGPLDERGAHPAPCAALTPP